jgi:hypothetical protein
MTLVNNDNKDGKIPLLGIKKRLSIFMEIHFLDD